MYVWLIMAFDMTIEIDNRTGKSIIIGVRNLYTQ